MRGKFFVFEGIDGSGTSTQIEILARMLREHGLSVHTTREPSDGEIGKMIRRRISTARERPRIEHPAALALLFAADRVDHIHGEVREALERGDIVLCDRYLWSSYTYQSISNDTQWIREINLQGETTPDKIFYFKLPATIAFERVVKRGGTRDEFEHLDFLKAMERLYEVENDRSCRLSERDGVGVPPLVVDATKSVEEVTASLWSWFVEDGIVTGQ